MIPLILICSSSQTLRVIHVNGMKNEGLPVKLTKEYLQNNLELNRLR